MCNLYVYNDYYYYEVNYVALAESYFTCISDPISDPVSYLVLDPVSDTVSDPVSDPV